MPRLGLKLTYLLALLALPMAAQFHGEQGAPLGAGVWPNSVPITLDPAPADQPPSGTISAELLQYPLSSKARHMLQKAVQLSDAGDHAQAVKQLQKTLVKFPGTGAYVYSLIGVEYMKTRQFPEAIDALEQAVKLLPHDASNHANLGLALVSNGERARAEPELRRALELDPHYAMARQLLGVLILSKNLHK